MELPELSQRFKELPPMPYAVGAEVVPAVPGHIGVMVPVLNDKAGIRDLLIALAHQTCPASQLEIVVSDNGSTDGSAETVREVAAGWGSNRFASLRVLDLGGNRGATVAYNRALAELSDACVAVLKLDSDVILHPQCLSRMYDRLLSDPKILAVGGREYSQLQPDCLLTLGMRFDPWNLRPCFPGLLDEGIRKEVETCGAARLDAAAGACVLMDAAALRAAGGLDEVFFVYYDDMDLGLRLLEQGGTSVMDPRAVYWHRKSATTGARAVSPFHRFHEARSSVLFGRKYAARTQGRSRRFAIRWNVRSILKYFLTFRFRTGWAGWRGMMEGMRIPLDEAGA